MHPTGIVKEEGLIPNRLEEAMVKGSHAFGVFYVLCIYSFDFQCPMVEVVYHSM